MLAPEELKKVRYYSAIITEAGGDVTVLTSEESRELASLLEKWSQQESHSPERSILPEPYQTEVRKELRKLPTWKLKEAYEKLKVGEPTGIEPVEKNRAYAISAIGEVLWERGKLERGSEKLLPMPPEEGPPLPKGLELRWPWKKD